MQPAVPQVDLGPAKLTKLSRTQSMTMGKEDRSCIPWTIAASLACGINQALDFRFR